MANPPRTDRDWSSDRAYEAAGLFIRMLGSIERGKFTEANRTRNKLAAMGYVIAFRPAQDSRGDLKGVAR